MQIRSLFSFFEYEVLATSMLKGLFVVNGSDWSRKVIANSKVFLLAYRINS